ncbi:hypothetical protein Tsp_13507 [Trichinella spiralis]|uniref:hypothetical protein n=1 Tax=Trichinella spiralis TaxID=6334 RepID=UPI0001EFED84|nr:hypothetical protein Tsp_13507 [Trichinella spiralis]
MTCCLLSAAYSIVNVQQLIFFHAYFDVHSFNVMSWGKELWVSGYAVAAFAESVKRWKLFSGTRSFNITDLARTALGASRLTLLVRKMTLAAVAFTFHCFTTLNTRKRIIIYKLRN